ncbi:MAG: 2-oxoacid:ferredoxin oxidoreductase subunit beta [Patescibacteria group bacterium]
MLNQKDYTSSYTPTWCPGCGNFSIYPATKMALAQLGIEPHRVAMVFDIGCSSNGSNFYHLYSFHSIHGRALPVAEGVKLANHSLHVIADSGDGGAYGEGISHFVHSCRSNIDMTYLVHDNHLYSLTKGQASPTSNRGMKTKSTPYGIIDQSFNPLATAIINGATFVAQAFSADIPGMTEIIKQAIQHRGFAFVNILQLCPTFNKINTLDWYKQRVYKLSEAGHDSGNYTQAVTAATQPSEKLPLGILYQIHKPTYEEGIPSLSQMPLVQRSVDRIDITESLKTYN